MGNALQNDAWVDQINLYNELTMVRIREFITLWTHVSQLHLHDDHPNNITWKLAATCRYSATSADKVQFLGATTTSFNGTTCD